MRFFVALVLVLGLFAPPAHAAVSLSYDLPVPEISRININRFVGSPDILIAAADLNADGLNEFIVRPKDCSPCAFRILAENNDKITELGGMTARALALGEDYTQGVRSLLAYESPANDYDYTVYVWEPAQARYMIAGQK